jgi:hypothetical protein
MEIQAVAGVSARGSVRPMSVLHSAEALPPLGAKIPQVFQIFKQSEQGDGRDPGGSGYDHTEGFTSWSIMGWLTSKSS